MDCIEDLFWKVLGIIVIIVGLVWGAAILIDTRPSCWFSHAPYLCERIAKLEEQNNDR